MIGLTGGDTNNVIGVIGGGYKQCDRGDRWGIQVM